MIFPSPLAFCKKTVEKVSIENILNRIPYFSAHCISDHRTSKPNPNPNSNPNHNPNPNPNPDNSPDHYCSHLLVRDAVVRNEVGREKGVTSE